MPESKRALGSNLAKLDATTDEDIARQIAEDPDTAPELTDAEWEQGEIWHGNRFIRRVGRPKGSGTKELVTLRLDHAILDHFRAGGPGWQTRLNDTLQEVVAGKHRRPLRDIDADLIAEVLKAMPSGSGRPADIRKALQSAKGVEIGFVSIRRLLGELADRHEVASSEDGKTWRYVGSA